MQDYKDVQWLPRLSIPRKGQPDLNRQYNAALKEADGDLIVSLQDWIAIPSDALTKIVEWYKKYDPDLNSAAVTFPVLKSKEKVFDIFTGNFSKDWRGVDRPELGDPREVPSHQWEIDLAAAPRSLLIDVGGFDEEMDQCGAIGGENCVVGAKLQYLANCKFYVSKATFGVAYDHDQEGNIHKGAHQSANIDYMNKRIAELKADYLRKI